MKKFIALAIVLLFSLNVIGNRTVPCNCPCMNKHTKTSQGMQQMMMCPLHHHITSHKFSSRGGLVIRCCQHEPKYIEFTDSLIQISQPFPAATRIINEIQTHDKKISSVVPALFSPPPENLLKYS